jgi:hypothetical protein
MSQANAKAPKAPKKPVQYAKNAKAGNVVQIKGCHVTSHGQLRRWFGLQADTNWFTGTVQEIIHTTVGKTKRTLYEVKYIMPDGSDKVLQNKNIHHLPGVWKDPDPPPRVSVLGAGHSHVPAAGRRVQGPPSVDSDASSVDSMLEAVLARARGQPMSSTARPVSVALRVHPMKIPMHQAWTLSSGLDGPAPRPICLCNLSTKTNDRSTCCSTMKCWR